MKSCAFRKEKKMFESIANFFKKLVKSEAKDTTHSKDTAKERLHLVLMQDRANVSADFLELMKQEIIEVIKKYIEVEESAIDVRLTNEVGEDGKQGAPSLYANIPILNIKNDMKNAVKKDNENNFEADNKKEKSKQIEKDDNNLEKTKENEKESETIEKKQTEIKEDDKKSEEQNDKKEDVENNNVEEPEEKVKIDDEIKEKDKNTSETKNKESKNTTNKKNNNNESSKKKK